MKIKIDLLKGVTYLRFSPFRCSINEGGYFANCHVGHWGSQWFFYVYLFGWRWHNSAKDLGATY